MRKMFPFDEIIMISHHVLERDVMQNPVRAQSGLIGMFADCHQPQVVLNTFYKKLGGKTI